MAREVVVQGETSGRPQAPRSGRLALASLPLLLAAIANLAYSGHGSLLLQALASRASGSGAWAELKNERPALSLDRTAFAGQPAKAVSYRHKDGSRNDWIKAGAMLQAAPNVNFSIIRQTEAKPLTSTGVSNLEDIAELGTVGHSYRSTYYALSTRFGDLSGVMFDVAAEGIRKYCLGFHKPVSALIFVKGYVCAPNAADANPQRVACLIDQIRYASPADEAALEASLGPDEARPCGAAAIDPGSSANRDSF
jgi:hypothetical protein